MGEFTKENLLQELRKIEECPLTPKSLELYVLLHKAAKYAETGGQGFTEHDAAKWVEHMDPPARWSMEQTNIVMKQRGYSCRPCEFWVVMNALASDYGKTLAKHGADKPEVWADLAYDWLTDADAAPDKLERYWREIAGH